MIQILLLFFVLIFIINYISGSPCHNSCSGQGICTKWSTCNCFTGFEGNDCSRKSCPSGPQYSDIPYDTDSAHQSLPCSGQGKCNYKTGICDCKKGYYGVNCGHLKCFNDCSGKGECISLRHAATLNNGYNFNRTTVYNRWDADVIFGCNCDPGWSGPDCSERVCEYGADPRLSEQSHEVVTLVCSCNPTCAGKFKLQFLGRVLDKWFTPSSLGSDIATYLMKIPGVFPSVLAVNGSVPICASSTNTSTLLQFKRNAGDLPSLSFYANVFTAGLVYFQTSQYLSCHCLGAFCTGTFRISFDGEMSDRISVSDTGATLFTTLNSMRTIQSAGITAFTGTTLDLDHPICRSGTVQNHSLLFHAPLGNVPRLGLWTSISVSPDSFAPTPSPTPNPSLDPTFLPSINPSFKPSQGPSQSPSFKPSSEPTISPTFSPSVDPTTAFNDTVFPSCTPTTSPTSNPTPIPSQSPSLSPTFSPTFSPSSNPTLSPSSCPTLHPSHFPSFSPTPFSTNLTSVLRLSTSDGRDDHVKLCNGIGRCDFSSGVCVCPYGWGFNASLGTCGKLIANTSQWAGLARCPGVTNPYTQDGVLKDQSDRQNYRTRIYISVNPSSSSYNNSNNNFSAIYYYTWEPSVNSLTFGSKRTLFVNLSSHSSAGPLVLDQARSRIFYVDTNPSFGFIGVAYISPSSTYSLNHSVWLDSSATNNIFGFASDALFSRRKLYWTSPGYTNAIDGNIYYAYMDANPPTAYSLTAAIGQVYLIDPHGIAVHYISSRLYWVDRDSSLSHSVLRSCNFDGSSYRQDMLYRQVDNHTVSANVTDLVIDFQHNNTAILLDSSFPAAILSTNLDYLDSPISYDSSLTDDFVTSGYLSERVVLTTYQLNMTSPRYLLLDEWRTLVLLSDTTQIGAVRYKEDQYADPNSPGIALDLDDEALTPVGMLIDRGLGSPQWGEYLDCYGNGVCMGLEGNYECRCHKGFYGDCQARTCPTGHAWFHEPAVDNVAHDELSECSNMGLCDRTTGVCQCREGFEGTACERMSCQGDDRYCNGRGRCLSMRNLAGYNKDVFRQPDPVTYGSKPNNADTWDADMIYGCVADDYGYYEVEHNITSYSGAALDELQCPNGYNVRLLDHVYSNGTSFIANYTQLREIQQINCKAISGSFYLSFRGYETTQLSFNVTASELLSALEALPSVGSITVTYYITGYGGGLCHSTDGRYATVLFSSEIGYVPLIEVVGSTLYGNHIQVNRVQAGSTKGLLECAGNGECNKQTGECMCWSNRGSSDGFGSVGNRGDCGFNLIY